MFRCKMVNFFFGLLPLKIWRGFLVRRHIESCPSCQARLTSREEVRSLLVEKDGLTSAQQLWHGIEAGLETRPETKEREARLLGWKRWRWAAVAAGLFIVGLTSFWLFKGYQQEITMSGGEASERFRINYLRVDNKPAQAYLYQPRESNMIIIWVEKSS